MNENRESMTNETTSETTAREAVRSAARPGRTVRAATLAAFLALGGVLVACGPSDTQDADEAGAFGEGGAPAMTEGPTTPDMTADAPADAPLGGTDVAAGGEGGTVAGGGAGTDASAGDAAASGETDAVADPVAGSGGQQEQSQQDGQAQQQDQQQSQQDAQTVALTTEGETLVVDEANSEVPAAEQGIQLAVGERYEFRADGPVALVDAEGTELLAADASDAAFASDPEVAFESSGDGIAFTLTQDLADLAAGVETEQGSLPVTVQGN